MLSDILKLVWSDPKKPNDDHSNSLLKRGRSTPDDTNAADEDVAAYEQKAKRPKLDSKPDNTPSYCLSMDMDVFQAAKDQDAISIFYNAQAMNYVVGLWCVWASQRSSGRGSRKQLTVVLVENDDLVEQTFGSLKLLQPKIDIGKISDLEDSWKDTEWLAVMNKDVAVMTSDSFLYYYRSEAIVFNQIGLLIFQQADLALQLDNPMSEVALTLVEAHQEDKPRVIGILLQAPGNTKANHAHLDIERVFNARLFGHGVSPLAANLLAKTPKEVVVRFEPPKKVVDTALCKHLRSFSKSEVYFRSEFRSAKILLREVGPFAADWVWRRALKSMSKELDNPLFDEDESIDSPEKQEANTTRNVYKSIKNWTFTIPNLDIGSRGFNVSPKIASLVHILQCFEQDAEGFRGIVLVRRRITVLAIVEVLRTVSSHLPFIRVEALTGPWTHDNVSHLSILRDFTAGKCNLLVATKIAEDGVEVPPCSCIIRYDTFDSTISYAHTRALANGPGCHLVFMLDSNSDVARRTMRNVARMPEHLRHWSQLIATRDTGAYPPADILQTTDYYHSDSEEEADSRSEYIKDPTMSGKLYVEDAVNVIYRYFSTLPSASRPTITSRAIFRFTSTSSSEHVCTLIFPPSSPFPFVQGPSSASKTSAKRATCFKACKQLHALGLLPYQLFPRPKEVARRLRPVAVFIDEEVEQTKGDILPTLPPAPLPPSQVFNGEDTAEVPTVLPDPKVQLASGTRCYKRKFAEFWRNAVEEKHEAYYPTIVTVDRNNNPSKPYRPILLITRTPLPTFGEIKLHFAATHSMTYLRPGHPLQLDDQKLSHLHRYTLRAMRAVMNKPLTCTIEELPFFLAPLDFSWDVEIGKTESRWPYPDISEYIPWDLVIYAAEQHLVPLRTETLESLEEDIKDAVIQDWWTEFTKRYDCMRLRRDLNPLTPLDDLAKIKNPTNLVEICKIKRKGFEGLVDYNQPLIEVSNLPSTTNRLVPMMKTFTPNPNGSLYSAKFVIPELCSKFTIPASTMRTLSLLPSIMKRIDDTLLVSELNAMYFHNEIEQSALQAAITTPSAGMEIDYERLELLGDAYLKYLSSIYLFVTNPTKHEGILHIARQKIISNKALLVNADKSGLPQYIQSKPFLPKLWIPRGYSILKPEIRAPPLITETKDSEAKPKDDDAMVEDPASSGPVEQDPQAVESGAVTTIDDDALTSSKSKRPYYDDDHQWLGDKCVADVAEAIIGAAYQTGGPELGLKIVKLLHIPLPFIDSWEDFALKAKNPPPDITDPLEDNVLESVESIVGARFHLPHILAQALTHTSIRGNDMICYERLEFLGDAILDFLVIRHIFDLHGRLSPGALTLLKGAMVSNSVLAAISVHYGLHRYLRIESQSVKSAINQYIPEIEEKRRAEFEAAKQEERPCGQYWLEVEPPKSIADVVESIMGALYVSDGFDLKGVQAMYDTMLRPFYDQHISLKTLSHHPTKILFELFQSQGCQEFQIAKYMHAEDQSLIRCEVEVHNVILTVGIDASPVLAARKASLEALDALEGDPAFMSRVCDCRAKAEQRKAAKKSARAQLGKNEVRVAESDEEDLEL